MLPTRPRTVPSSRLSRLAGFGRLAGGIAGNVIGGGAREMLKGQRPDLPSLLLNPANAKRLADELARLRGAAMKLGQLISMDGGEVLPRELSDILARLRSEADPMPEKQLEQVLVAGWGPEWRAQFQRFDMAPIAAASIGQVHRAVALDGRDLAIKVQYPGVAESIDADVDNVATLLQISGVLPRGLNVAPLLAEAKRQLAEETDYVREGRQMTLFGRLLSDTPEVVVPALDPDLSTSRVLAMTYLEGDPIESLETAPRDRRDAVIHTLMTLVLRELFEFGVMQTDPNFANYRVQPKTGRLVLLDFGAARPVDAATADGYRELLRAAMGGDRARVRDAALAAGFLGPAVVARRQAALNGMIDVILGELNRPGPFDFGQRGFVATLRDQGMEIAADPAAWHLPPTGVLFAQRKISGTALLAAKLGARVDVRALVGPWLDDAPGMRTVQV